MISIPSSASIYLHTQPTDMRKSFDGLCGIVRSQFQQDPLDGSLFVFINRRRDRVKLLYWDSDGLALWYKRLERGTFEFSPADNTPVTIDTTQLTMLLAGVPLATQRRNRFRRSA